MGKQDTQRAAHVFLLERLQSQQPFTIAEFSAATGWDKPGTFKTYLRKHYKGLIENIEGGPFKISDTAQYRVTESFRKLVTWRKFRQHVTQVRRVVTNYEPTRSEVLIYDFLMPLTNEAYLRTTLDALFFKDAIVARLKTILMPSSKSISRVPKVNQTKTTWRSSLNSYRNVLSATRSAMSTDVFALEKF